MKPLQKKINSYINTAIIYAILMILLGLILLLFPEFSLDLIRWVIAIALVAGGIALMVNDLRRQTIGSFFSGSILGVVLLVMGVIVIAHPNVLGVIPIVLGAYMIVSSVISLRLTSSLKEVSTSGFYLSLLSSAISIICGIILIANPFFGAIAITSLLGIVSIVYGVSDIVDLIVFRNNINEVAKYLKSKVEIVEGEEVK